MDTSKLKKFAQYARRSLIEQVQSKLKLVLAEESEARRESSEAVFELEKKLAEKNEEQLIEQVAYLWFNRFCALRFMDVNQYNRIMVISPLAGQFQPEILAEAKAGHIDEGVVSEATREKVFGLLSGSVASRDGQSEAFRQLIVAVCNDLHRIMPYLFERIEDYTELLMPDDLLSGNSILAYTREAMTPEACESVESIGWLYQFYISEKKDKVFDDLKKNKKITPENIPAATQLFTPHWIVRYLVENSLGRLWMLNNPSSKVIEQMDYYIKPVDVETDFLRIKSPEEIKICDPACGSGHMLTYAYDLLYAIYLDAGYDSTEIPEKILINNLYGIEIDERAAELAAFALTMKAVKGNPEDESNNRRRFFRNPVKPNICRLENVRFTEDELDSYIEFTGKDLFTQDLRATLKEFEETDNFGSLIQPTLKAPADALATLESKDVSGQLFLTETHKSVLKVLKQADYLSPKYHVIVANPPYMGGARMNSRLKEYARKTYPISKTDLFSMFMERCLSLVCEKAFVAMITLQNWMFISSFEKHRKNILDQSIIRDLIQIGFNSFPSLNSKFALGAGFVLHKGGAGKGAFINLNDAPHSSDKEEVFFERLKSGDVIVVNPDNFSLIPGNPVQYTFSEEVFSAFANHPSMGDVADARNGITTGDNEKYVRLWHEVSLNKSSLENSGLNEAKWFPYNKGGAFRKWYGNQECFLDWQHDGSSIKSIKPKSTPRNTGLFFNDSVSWSDINIKNPSFRYYSDQFCFDAATNSAFPSTRSELLRILSAANNCFVSWMGPILNPTMHFKIGDFEALPACLRSDSDVESDIEELIDLSKYDWDTYETSWEFSKSPLVDSRLDSEVLHLAYKGLREFQEKMISDVRMLEEKNNKIYIRSYGLEDELLADVAVDEVTLTCNPKFRYGGKATVEKLENRFLENTIQEFLSYSVSCMFGRYSLDREGLILANQGDTLEDYLKQVPQPSFIPDDDNVIPLIDFDGDWFEDDITERFKQFLKVTFGEEYFSVNLAFIEEAIGKDIKKFFLKDFYADHVKRYKKRPIYWMFSSPKGSFNALIYMHRYRPDTVSVVLNDYLREFRTKLQARKESYEQVEISASASAKEKTQAIKTIQKINKVLDEVNDYERDILYPLAGKAPEIDLDDGVKHNYPLFGKALKKITGLS
jgi:hypothetical protein